MRDMKVGLKVATILVGCVLAMAGTVAGQTTRPSVNVVRLLDRPIISPDLDMSIGPNIQGPSLIRVPDWAPRRLGNYYMYFADHKGRYIRLAYAGPVRSVEGRRDSEQWDG